MSTEATTDTEPRATQTHVIERDGERVDLVLRPIEPRDNDAALALAERISSFGPPEWRDAEQLRRVDRDTLRKAIEDDGPDRLIVVAAVDAQVIGLMHATCLEDYYTRRSNAHLADLVVDAAWAGHGIGSLLMQRAEAWARARGDDWLSLSVFPQNEGAVRLYERSGFRPDIARYVKPIKPAT